MSSIRFVQTWFCGAKPCCEHRTKFGAWMHIISRLGIFVLKPSGRLYVERVD